jgi:hypothetical protein
MSCKLTDVDILSCAHLPSSTFPSSRKSGANGGTSREEEGRHGGWHEGHRSCRVPPGIYRNEGGKGGGEVSDQYVEKRYSVLSALLCRVQ